MLEFLWILILILVSAFIAVALVLRLLPIKRVFVFEYQKGLKYSRGRYMGILDPGSYWILKNSSTVTLIDIRPESITIQGQDVLSSDGVTLKISLAAEFQVIDPNLAINRNQNFRTTLYLTLQMALREIVGKEKIDALLENRAQIGAKLMELVTRKASEMGLKLIAADVKDIMFAGEMKKAFSEVVKAQKEGQAALERARGETAALRNLANAARVMDDNPNLLQLRALQTLSDSSGNTLVLGLPNGAVPLGRKSKNDSPSPPTKEPATE